MKPRLFRDVSIKKKVILVTAMTCSVALFISATGLFVYDFISFRNSMADKLDTLNRVIGANISAALIFEDPVAAEEDLAALKEEPNLIVACLYDRDGKVIAIYRRADSQHISIPSEPEEDAHRFVGGYLEAVHTLTLGGETIGTLFLRSDMREMRSRLKGYLGIVACIILVTTIMVVFLSLGIQGAIVRPLLELLHAVNKVTTKKDYTIRAEKLGNDEVGMLTEGFNDMLTRIEERDEALQRAHDSLEERVEERTKELTKEIVVRQETEDALKSAQRRLMDAARQAGMAEIATSVLHNVGNVLNSVNVSATLIKDILQNSKTGQLHRVADMVRDHLDDFSAFVEEDEKGKLLPRYLIRLAESVEGENRRVVEELELLVSNIEHTKRIVSMQQSYAGMLGTSEAVSLIGLVEDATQINGASLERHGITVNRVYTEVPECYLDKHKVLQILVNLIRNAKYALIESEATEKLLTCRIGMNGEKRIRVEVSDNGVGIPEENLSRIFSLGFTTRKDGHGYGLHNSALAAKDVGGSLTARSEGPGRGATFILEVPYINSEDRP